jgi:hypothetical protein
MYWNYVSCVLTIVSTVMVGKRQWPGWILAGINSVIVCFIGYQTKQWGFIPANIFCLAIYAYNIRKWREQESETVPAIVNAPPQIADALQTPAFASDRIAASDGQSHEKLRRFRHSVVPINAGNHRFRVRTSTARRASWTN